MEEFLKEEKKASRKTSHPLEHTGVSADFPEVNSDHFGSSLRELNSETSIKTLKHLMLSEETSDSQTSKTEKGKSSHKSSLNSEKDSKLGSLRKESDKTSITTTTNTLESESIESLDKASIDLSEAMPCGTASPSVTSEENKSRKTSDDMKDIIIQNKQNAVPHTQGHGHGQGQGHGQIGKKRKMCVNDFEILFFLGEGAYAKVVLVRYIQNGKTYAMKIIEKKHLVKVKNLVFFCLQFAYCFYLDKCFFL